MASGRDMGALLFYKDRKNYGIVSPHTVTAAGSMTAFSGLRIIRRKYPDQFREDSPLSGRRIVLIIIYYWTNRIATVSHDSEHNVTTVTQIRTPCVLWTTGIK